MSTTTMSPIELEMQKAKEAYAKKMEALKRKAAAEEKRIDARVIEVLKTEHEDLYTEVRDAAVQQLEAERAERSQAAKKARDASTEASTNAEHSDPDDSDDADDSMGQTFLRSA